MILSLKETILAAVRSLDQNMRGQEEGSKPAGTMHETATGQDNGRADRPVHKNMELRPTKGKLIRIGEEEL